MTDELQSLFSPRFGERYQIVELIGRGGMGCVYKGVHRTLDRPVAIKVLGDEFFEDSGARERFLQEARLLAGLSHPNVVGIHDAGTDRGHLYLVMEFLPGPSLRERLAREGALPPDRALAVARDVVRALRFAHGRDVIHRDVKPENILLTEDGTAKLADFGIARPVDLADGRQRLTRTGVILGTPAYMAPEHARGDEVGPGSDLYSLGVVLFEMLSGKVPFSADTSLKVLLKQIDEPPPAPSSLVPDLHPDVDRVVASLLAKDPARRYRDARRVERALDRLLAVAKPGAPSREARRPAEPTPSSPTLVVARTVRQDEAARGTEGTWLPTEVEVTRTQPGPTGRRLALGLAAAVLVLGAALAVLFVTPRGKTGIETARRLIASSEPEERVRGIRAARLLLSQGVLEAHDLLRAACREELQGGRVAVVLQEALHALEGLPRDPDLCRSLLDELRTEMARAFPSGELLQGLVRAIGHTARTEGPDANPIDELAPVGAIFRDADRPLELRVEAATALIRCGSIPIAGALLDEIAGLENAQLKVRTVQLLALVDPRILLGLRNHFSAWRRKTEAPELQSALTSLLERLDTVK